MTPTLYKHNRVTKWLAALPVLFVVIFVVVPVVNIFSTWLQLDSLKILRTSTIAKVVWFTTWQATFSTALSLSLALPIAAVVANFQFKTQRLMMSLVSIPFILPSIVVGAAFLKILPNNWHRTAFALILAHTYFNFGFAARLISTRWLQIHPHLDDAARTLGATTTQVFTSITLKLLRPVITNAALVVFTLCFTSYGVVRILGGPSRSTIETEIYFRAMQLGDISGALLLSVLQIVIITAVFYLAFTLNRTPKNKLVSTTISRQKSLQSSTQKLFTAVVCLVATALALIPMAAIFASSLITNSRFSTTAWRSMLSESEILSSLATSLRYAIFTILIATLLSLLAASSIAYGNNKFRSISILTSTPIVISAVSIGLGIIITFDTKPFDWRGAQFMLPIAHALVALPIAMRMILPVLNDLPDSLRQASSLLGATNWQTWRLIDLKIIRRAIVGTAAISAAVSLGEFGASSFLVRRGAETLPIKISQLLSRPGAIFQSQAYALASLLIIFSIAIILVIDKFTTTEGSQSHSA